MTLCGTLLCAVEMAPTVFLTDVVSIHQHKLVQAHQ